MWSFPRLEKPSVFIAAPGDVKYLRQVASREVKALKDNAIDGDAFDLYDWKIDKSDSGFEDWVPAQGQIPLPTDPNCKLIICIFGARIGTPLPFEFPTKALGSYATQVSTRGHRILVPWRDGAENEGCFSLTGSVFEFLATLGNRGKADPPAPPVLLLFVGDESIGGDVDLLDANWGDVAWLRKQ